jgi:hypothetical protein
MKRETKMKKLVMLLASLSIAGFVNAAAVQWNSGQLYAPNPDGTFSSTKIGSSSAYTAVVYFFVDNGGVVGEAVAGVTGTTDPTASLSAFGLTTSDSFTGGSTYWTYLSVTSNDGIYSMTSDTISFVAPLTGNAGVNFTALGAMPSQWTVVPEPTSMALLALGVATIGLHRRFRA